MPLQFLVLSVFHLTPFACPEWAEGELGVHCCACSTEKPFLVHLSAAWCEGPAEALSRIKAVLNAMTLEEKHMLQNIQGLK